MASRILIERNVAIPMRDGTILKSDIYRPDTDRPVPAIVSRLPYNKDLLTMQNYALVSVRAAEAGFAVVFQDTRGRYQSEGEFYPFMHEGQDGYDTVEWVAAQPWCSGAVGMSGASYFGATQWLAAVEQPPHLKAIFPIITASEYYEGWTYQGGAFQLGFALIWTLISLAPDTSLRQALAGRASPQEMEQILLGADRMDAHYGHLPLATQPLLKPSQAAKYYFDWIEHSSNDGYWQSIAVNRHYDRVLAPAYNVGGWYDLFLLGTLENYTGMRQAGGNSTARQGQRLLIGPWAHGVTGGIFPEYNFGIFSSLDVVDITGLQLKFFGKYLKGEDTGLDQDMPVRLFVMGENRWRDEPDWPLARAQYTPWYIHSEGFASSAGGELSPLKPADEPADVYLYDPRNPTPTVGGPSFLPGLGVGANSGPRDQRDCERRPDVLVYTSAPLDQPLEVTGPLQASLYAATSAADTDFVARLCDVYPDGAARILAEGILRARFRAGCDQPQPVEPGQVYRYDINLVATSNLFLPGHRIRLDIASSSFPRFDANTNTGHPLGQDGPQDVQPALQTIYHTAAYPSHILLPVIPR
ncbi:MAG: CocE/NonD family hydrolase [Chloroflexi bacterium]|nr:CocE/NonD family hydrolase [Chloroflexota bacterium]